MLFDFVINLINVLINIVGSALGVIFSILPNSPFSSISLNPIANFLGYMNYFIPVVEIVSILTLWGSAIGIYYIYQIALRWLKVVE